jgi:hypothetical protein
LNQYITYNGSCGLYIPTRSVSEHIQSTRWWEAKRFAEFAIHVLGKYPQITSGDIVFVRKLIARHERLLRFAFGRLHNLSSALHGSRNWRQCSRTWSCSRPPLQDQLRCKVTYGQGGCTSALQFFELFVQIVRVLISW